MAGAGLLDIKRRVNSVQNTKKITKAMGLVATAKLRKAKNSLKINTEYFNNLDKMKENIFSVIEVGAESPFIEENGSNKKLVVLFASNSGLCGGFNANVTTYLNNLYGNERENVSVYLLGRRGESYIKRFNFNLYDKFYDYKDEILLKDSRTIASRILDGYLNKEFGQVSIIYTKFKSSVTQEVVEEKIVPFIINNEDIVSENGEIKNTGSERIIYDSEIEDEKLVGVFLYRYVEGKLINSMMNSKTSEETLRMQAMDGATKNADEIIEKLQIKYNRIRQSAITQEISEIVGGAEAQK